MDFASHEIRDVLLREGGEVSDPDLVYALFLEDAEEGVALQSSGWYSWAIEKAAGVFAPRPAYGPGLVHCELLVPAVGEETRCNFATYLGVEKGAGWQEAGDADLKYYCLLTARRWRAVAVRAPGLAARVREAGDAAVGAPYSVLRYLTSVRPLRGLSWLLPDTPTSAGHCATVTARVLKGAGAAVKHAAAYYAPATLYEELTHADPVAAAAAGAGTAVDLDAREALVDGAVSRARVSALGDAMCFDAVQALARQCEACEGHEGRRQAQRELASALLRWTLLRSKEEESDSTA